MSLGTMLAVLVGVSLTAVAAALLLRQRAPDGGFFNNGDRPAGVLGVLSTSFAVLLGFVIFFAINVYDTARVSSGDEAMLVTQLYEDAEYFSDSARAPMQAMLQCYGREVVSQEFPAMQHGAASRGVANTWGVRLALSLKGLEPKGPVEETALSKWMELNSSRENARLSRRNASEDFLPAPLWFALLAMASVVSLYVVFFADKGERWWAQALSVAAVVSFTTVSVLVVDYLAHPYRGNPGNVGPGAMQTSLQMMAAFSERNHPGEAVPCDEQGRAQK